MTHPAIDFLHLLDPSPGAAFNIETYTDVAKGSGKPGRDPLARRYSDQSLSDVETLLAELQKLNDQGAGIFVAVNAFDGNRKRESLSRVRGVHADLDGVDDETLSQIRSKLKPTIEVQTSGPNNWHFYWLLTDGETMSAEEAEALNRGLVELGADRAAVDVSRLLRLPGFRHMKGQDGGRSDA